MNKEEKEAIENTKNILKEWQKIVDIKDPIERDIEMSMYSEEMPFYTMKILLNLIDKLQKENEEQKEREKYTHQLEKELEQEKEKNKKLNLENQALFESINCNDDNMLARKYQKLQKENDTLKTTINKQSKDISEQLKELDKSNKRIDMCIDLLNLEGCLKFDTKQEKLDYIDRLVEIDKASYLEQIFNKNEHIKKLENDNQILKETLYGGNVSE